MMHILNVTCKVLHIPLYNQLLGIIQLNETMGDRNNP
jgi:hypothetical protein